MKRGAKALIAASICLLLMLAGAAVLRNSQRALAQQESTGRLNIGLMATDYALKGRPVMISAIRDGKVVNQHEVQFRDIAGDTGDRRGWRVIIDGHGLPARNSTRLGITEASCFPPITLSQFHRRSTQL